MGKVIGTKEASTLTGYTASHIRQLAARSEIEAVKVGRDWLIDRNSIIEYKQEMESLGSQKHSPHRKEG